MNRKVKHAVLHEGLFVPGVGNLGKTLSLNDPQFKYWRDLTLEWEPGTGLVWSIRGRSGVMPSANVVMVEYAPEDKITPTSSVKIGPQTKSQAV